MGGQLRHGLVSVVITTRNRRDLVQEAISSVLNLDRDGFDVEIIVVNDGSTDDTNEVLEQLPVQVIETTGIGIAAARNAGVNACTGTFVQVLDDDDVLLPDALSARLSVFAEHPEYGAVHGRAQLTHPDLTPFGEPFPRAGSSSGWILDDLLRYFPQIGTVLTRRSVFDEIGDFDVNFDGIDEWDFFLRTSRHYEIGRIGQTSMLFRQRVGSAQEEIQWQRSRHVITIFAQHTAHLPVRTRMRARLRFFKTRGRQCATFVDYALINWHQGQRRRAAKSFWYACRWSPLHAPVGLVRQRHVDR